MKSQNKLLFVKIPNSVALSFDHYLVTYDINC